VSEQPSNSDDYPPIVFWSLDSAIADMVISAIQNKKIWESYRPIDKVGKKRWRRIGAKIEAAMRRHSFGHEAECTDGQFEQGWRLLGEWFGALWN